MFKAEHCTSVSSSYTSSHRLSDSWFGLRTIFKFCFPSPQQRITSVSFSSPSTRENLPHRLLHSVWPAKSERRFTILAYHDGARWASPDLPDITYWETKRSVELREGCERVAARRGPMHAHDARNEMFRSIGLTLFRYVSDRQSPDSLLERRYGFLNIFFRPEFTTQIQCL